MISLAQQIEECEREIALRNGVYPRMVSSGKMRQSIADYHMARMKAVLATLEWLQKNEAAIKAKMEETF
jgi:hypothetical protein